MHNKVERSHNFSVACKSKKRAYWLIGSDMCIFWHIHTDKKTKWHSKGFLTNFKFFNSLLCRLVSTTRTAIRLLTAAMWPQRTTSALSLSETSASSAARTLRQRCDGATPPQVQRLQQLRCRQLRWRGATTTLSSRQSSHVCCFFIFFLFVRRATKNCWNCVNWGN